MQLKVRVIFINLLLILLAFELKVFFDKGGQNNELAYSLFKIIFLLTFSLFVLNAEEMTKTMVYQFQKLNTPAKLFSIAEKLTKNNLS